MRIKNALVVGVILLFIGVAVQPSIAIVQPKEIDGEYVKITTDVCGLPWVKPQTKLLSREEAEEVDRLINSIKEQLNQAKTRNEVEDIFKKGIVELDRYGLLGDCSVEQVQRLVTKGLLNLKDVNLIEKLSQGKNAIWDSDSNNLCLISGKTTHTLFLGMLSAGVRLFSPIAVMNRILFGRIIKQHYYGTFDYYPSRGWVYTHGQKGIQSWNDKFWGNMNMFSFFAIYTSIIWRLWSKIMPGITPSLTRSLGVIGFSGVKLLFEDYDPTIEDYFYLGFALRVGLTYETPEHP